MVNVQLDGYAVSEVPARSSAPAPDAVMLPAILRASRCGRGDGLAGVDADGSMTGGEPGRVHVVDHIMADLDGLPGCWQRAVVPNSGV